MALVYFAPVAWDSYPQRPHYFVRHFLKRGGRVAWIDPYPTRLPTTRDLRNAVMGRRIAVERPANLTVVGLRALPLEPLAVGRWLNRRLLWNALARRLRAFVSDGAVVVGIGRPSDLALAALGALRPVRSFFDAMDDFPQFYRGVSKGSVSACEREIALKVDVVMTSSSALWTKFEPLGSRRIMLHNAFEMSALPPLPIARNGHVVFGYVGCIGAWFDWSTVVGLAEAFRDAAVHIVGPCFAKAPRRLPSNIRMFPACSLGGAIEHFQSFSVGLIPFERTPLTEGVDPIKYYGYRGMGLPVLSTTFGEMARRGVDEGVFLIDQRGGFVRLPAPRSRRGPSPAPLRRSGANTRGSGASTPRGCSDECRRNATTASPRLRIRLASAIMVGTGPTVRYLHPVAWMGVFVVVLLDLG